MQKTLLLFVVVLFTLSSCHWQKNSSEQKIVFVSILPLKYFTDQITGHQYLVEVMVPPGVGPETYSPTPRQMTGMSKALAYFAAGHLGFEEAWLGNFKSVNPGMEVVNTSEGVELITGLDEKHGDHNHAKGVDPHTWSSPKAAKTLAVNIFNGLAKKDPQNRSFFQVNLNTLLNKIDSVDRIVSGILNDIPNRKFMVFHPALGYFARDYQLTQLSIEFEGKAPTPKHMQNIIETALSENIHCILIQKEFDKENAVVVSKETNSTIIEIDPLCYDWPEQMISIAKKLAEASRK